MSSQTLSSYKPESASNSSVIKAPTAEKRPFILQEIAQNSCFNRNDSTKVAASPFIVLLNLMNNREKATIVIRNHHRYDEYFTSSCRVTLLFLNVLLRICVFDLLSRYSIRGFMHGYVKGFDRHFNIMLTDADEDRIVTKRVSLSIT